MQPASDDSTANGDFPCHGLADTATVRFCDAAGSSDCSYALAVCPSSLFRDVLPGAREPDPLNGCGDVIVPA